MENCTLLLKIKHLPALCAIALLFPFCATAQKIQADTVLLLGSGKFHIFLISGKNHRNTLRVIELQPHPDTASYVVPFDVYQFQVGDVDADGNPDLCVGVIKPTHFDSVVRKRLFIYQYAGGVIRPLWLGTRVSQPLENFRLVLINSKVIVRTVERELNGRFLVAEYRWRSFGLEFISYLRRNLPKNRAKRIFEK